MWVVILCLCFIFYVCVFRTPGVINLAILLSFSGFSPSPENTWVFLWSCWHVYFSCSLSTGSKCFVTKFLWCVDFCLLFTPRGAGYPLSTFAPPLSIHFLIFCSLLLFPFSFSHSLDLFPIFFYCPSLPFLSESSHSVSKPEVVGGDQTWV